MTDGTAVYQQRLDDVTSRIEEACRKAGRSAHEVTLIVVSKFHSQEVVRALAELGISNFGENRHQEAKQKAEATSDLELTWHFVGQLQSNKARQAARYSSAIHSLDREGIVRALTTFDGHVDGFIQVNLTDDPSRGGVQPDALEHLTEQVLETPTIALQGVMAVAPLDEEPASAFARLREYSERIQRLAPHATAISAGMTHDFETALQFGATHLRIGSAITGNRS